MLTTENEKGNKVQPGKSAKEQPLEKDGPAETEIKNAHASGDGSMERNDHDVFIKGEEKDDLDETPAY